ncbi:hypothetical protein [Porphyromonas circumdentaria]|uniref:Uncharacterized protein n=1 Tax=Porphyromonas circumdentaria TaxID=29524 RepID=A0A1T4PB74_9PORP|nr:hypothetical protein [Porphyromonas circumdentaria]MBB6276363.1 hypothetical protein [Porphyromonas circumdentaria]SJZ88803.1 hypothetical protein SAMN02745171_01394 [Porphyromonas circumdentaria]
MMILLLITLLIVGIALLLLGVRVFFVRGGSFPDTHIESSKALQKKGIGCANKQLEDATHRRNLFDRMDE